jgi:hypothetical protein
MTYTKFKKPYDHLNSLEKAVVRHAHPKAFILHIIGIMWGGYFLWTHELAVAILCFVGIIGIGELIGYLDKDYLTVARAQLNLFQKLLVYHADYKNLAYHTIGACFFFWGAWTNSVPRLLIAASFVLLGHMFPWNEHCCEEAKHVIAIGED